jgi:hypothetical protein
VSEMSREQAQALWDAALAGASRGVCACGHRQAEHVDGSGPCRAFDPVGDPDTGLMGIEEAEMEYADCDCAAFDRESVR